MIGLFVQVSAQVKAGFEGIELPLIGYRNDASPQSAFFSGEVAVPNAYFPTFDYWEGWAISAIKDNVTPGFSNQYSAIPGGGADHTEHYAVAYCPDGVVICLEGNSRGKPVQGMFVTNSTYAYYSMRDGDAFAKKFGGETGDDPDYFILTIRVYHEGQLGPDSVAFYLADYRSPISAEDYIVDTWEYIDLTSLGPADSLLMTLTSSDVGIFGMNTPTYFCIDEILTGGDISSIQVADRVNERKVEVWPNPTTDLLFTVSLEEDRFYEILDAQGRRRQSGTLGAYQEEVSLIDLSPGTYYLRLYDGKDFSSIPFIRL